MSNYENLGLVQRFKKIKKDILTKVESPIMGEPVFAAPEEVENEKEEESNSENSSENFENEENFEENSDQNSEENSENIEENSENSEENKVEKPKSELRKLIESQYPKVDIKMVPKLKEWEIPIMQKLINKHKDNFKVCFLKIYGKIGYV